LERSRRDRDRWAADSEHHREELLLELEGVHIDPVVRLEQPPSAPLLDTVQGEARGRHRGLREECRDVPVDQLRELGPFSVDLKERLDLDLDGLAGDLCEQDLARDPRPDRRVHVEHALAPDRRGLDAHLVRLDDHRVRPGHREDRGIDGLTGPAAKGTRRDRAPAGASEQFTTLVGRDAVQKEIAGSLVPRVHAVPLGEGHSATPQARNDREKPRGASGPWKQVYVPARRAGRARSVGRGRANRSDGSPRRA